jgi:hypothetical protein
MGCYPQCSPGSIAEVEVEAEEEDTAPSAETAGVVEIEEERGDKVAGK